MSALRGSRPPRPTAAIGLLITAWLGIGTAMADTPQRSSVRSHYLQYCSGCHLPDGRGSPATGVPALRGQLAEFLTVDGGRAYIVQVPGVMNTPLDDAQTAAMMNWLVLAMSPAGAPADFQPYTPEEVSQLRATRPRDVYARRQALLARLAANSAAREARP